MQLGKRVLNNFSVLSAVLMFFLSCKKDRNLPVEAAATFEDMIGKYLICDSIVSNITGSVVLERFGKGKGQDMTINQNNTISVYTSSQFTLVVNYELRKPDTLYNWHLGAYRHPEGYVFVRIPSKKKFRFYQKINDRYREFFYTVE